MCKNDASPDSRLSLSQCVSLACLLEVTAPKPGNVHRGADFEDLCFGDFAASSVAISQTLGNADSKRLGTKILDSIRATRRLVSTNTNLGICLLLGPLSMVKDPRRLETGELIHLIQSTDAADARDIFQAIVAAQPGGMGDENEHDVKGNAPSHILDAMALAQERDLIARQYCNGFQDVFRIKEEALASSLAKGYGILDAIVFTHVWTLAHFPDSLIQRKRGKKEAATASAMAATAINSVQGSLTGDYLKHLEMLDFWLRAAPGRNPGTTADVVTAATFCALREGKVALPLQW